MSRRLVVVLDTATEVTSVGLGWLEGGPAGSATPVPRAVLVDASVVDAHRAAMSRLLPTLESLLADNGLTVDEVADVIVGRGPGSFTGVRIGVATAKGLAHGLGAPLFGVGTLDAIAWNNADSDGLLGVVGDAMRGEVYPALFECEGGRARRLAADRVGKQADVAREWAELDRPMLLAGNGLRKYRDAFAEALGARATFAAEERWSPTAAGLLAAYLEAVAAGALGDGDPGAVLPIYTRLSDAEEAEVARVSAGPAEPGAQPGSGPTVPGSGVAGAGPR